MDPPLGRRLQLRSLEDLPDLTGKAVLVRATLDLPIGYHLHSPMAALRARRLEATLGWLLQRAARVTVCGDVAVPGSDPDPDRLAGVSRTGESIAPGVGMADASASIEDPGAIEYLVASHDVFVNDSFQWSYLPLPSLMVPPSRLPSAAGRGLQHDLEMATALLGEPERPFVAVLGGDNSLLRLHNLQGLVLRADIVVVGGAMSLPLLQAVGKWRGGVAGEFLAECRAVAGLGKRVRHEIQLPTDLVVTRPGGSVEVVEPEAHTEGDVVDIGPLSALRFSEALQQARTVLWCGVLGRVGDPRFAAGTRAVAGALLESGGQRTIIGGDSLVSLFEADDRLRPGIDVVSATDPLLELLKTGDLPALSALRGAQ